MEVLEFALKNKFSNVDKDIVVKLHSGEVRTEQEWFNLFNGNINFDATPIQKVISKKEKIEKLKVEKKSETKNK